MIQEPFSKQTRKARTLVLEADFIVAGGGLSGVCSALAAAREGTNVILAQDRPVLGGNASSEVRLWILGATSHMGNNNRWAREGGIIDEILLENLYRNKEGNPLVLDTILLEKVEEEPNITLLLNTAIYQVDKEGDCKISQLRAYCSQNETEYRLKAPLFCDATGDGVVAFQAGASFRMGAESPEEFGEGFAPDVEDYGELLGHSIYFYSKDTGRPVDFVAPSFALKDIGQLPRLRNYKLQDHGCRLWWVEFGGRMNTIHQSEDIKWELWKVVYGIWDYVKNSGEFPEAANLTLEWVGTIPGKRESRRFEGDYMLSQSDLVEQKPHHDAVAFGGWAMDLHPADGVFSATSGCTQWHTKGVYTIPYRCYYSKDIDNLFLAGRIISASHVAFGSSRVMATCAHGGQAVGMAASLANQHQLTPREVGQGDLLKELQLRLNKTGQSIPSIPIQDALNKANSARMVSNDQWRLAELPQDGPWMRLEYGVAQLLPLQKDQTYTFSLSVRAEEASRLQVELRMSEKTSNYTPEVILESKSIDIVAGEQEVAVTFETPFPGDHYGFLCLLKNSAVEVRGTNTRATGLVTVFNKENKAVSSFGKQTPPEGIGVDSFEFWMPIRRPGGHNLSFKVSPAIDMFGPENLNNGLTRPFIQPNAFVADPGLEKAAVDLFWKEEQTISKLVLFFDTDFDHALESSLMGHPECEIPFCVKNYEILNCSTTRFYQGKNNHLSVNTIELEEPIQTRHLQLIMERPMEHVPVALFEVLCY